ncbi:MAG: hypothetical protein JWN44_3427 [Myxococcales bacterium]|nr:hypothetical protein [Myxococcales bacterium]
MKRYIILAALAVFGCSNNNNGNSHEYDLGTGGNGGNGSDDGGGGGGADMAGGDMADVTVPPAPTATHVGATGTTCCMVAGSTRAAYLLNPTGTTTITGELHVVDKMGVDKKIDTGVTAAGFGITPGGKSIIYTKPSGTKASLFWADLTTATVAPKTVFTGTAYNATLAFAGFFSPSGKYFVVGVLPAGVSRSPDMHVIDTSNGNDVYQRLNGEFDYVEAVLPDDTMIFQDTAGGQSAGSTPVQTLYWISLPNAGSSTAAAISTHTSSLTPTSDNKTLLYLRTNGDLYAWNAMTKTGAGTKIASTVIKFTVGPDATGPAAYIAADHSVHVVGTDGTKLLDVAASAATSADLLSQIVLAPDGGDVFYFQGYETQNQRGTLLRANVKAGATPVKVGDKISSADLNVLDNALVLVRNVDDLGEFGEAVKANRDGSNIQSLGMMVPVGGLNVVNPGPGTWFAMHLNTAVKDPTAANVPVNGSAALYGALSFEDNGGAAVTLDAKVHAGAFSFAADDGRTAAFVTGATWNATAKNYVGALQVIAARDPNAKIDGKVSGCSELGPIVGRGLFVNAPTASPAGVYYVTF